MIADPGAAWLIKSPGNDNVNDFHPKQPPPATLPLHWHIDPDTGKRCKLPALTAIEVRYLFSLAERDRRRHPKRTQTMIRYRGRRFMVDGSVVGLRLWYGRVLLSRRYGWGL